MVFHDSMKIIALLMVVISLTLRVSLKLSNNLDGLRVNNTKALSIARIAITIMSSTRVKLFFCLKVLVGIIKL